VLKVVPELQKPDGTSRTRLLRLANATTPIIGVIPTENQERTGGEAGPGETRWRGLNNKQFNDFVPPDT
jgi:hypothetical protein